ncbi:MAG: hypothetical protein LUD81_08250 [Clostridiales bacterium]|nr:hypothetical protein [Clostridiales bacterium]
MKKRIICIIVIILLIAADCLGAWKYSLYTRYDERYALRLAAVTYEQMYGKEYSEDDFYIEAHNFPKRCWVVRSKEAVEAGFKEKGIGCYRLPVGLFIDRESGEIITYIEESSDETDIKKYSEKLRKLFQNRKNIIKKRGGIYDVKKNLFGIWFFDFGGYLGISQLSKQ